MKKDKIAYIRRIVCIYITLMFYGAGYMYGQQYTLEKQKEEFIKGNRDLCFLKKYVMNLKADSITTELDTVLGCYLLKLPLEERYSVENVKDIIAYMNKADGDIWLDIIKNWDKLSLGEDQKNLLVDKFNQNCAMMMLNWLKHRVGTSYIEKPDLEKINLAFIDTKMPLPQSKKVLVSIWQSFDSIPEMIDLTRQLFSDTLSLNGLTDWYILGEFWNYILERANACQCDNMLDILEMGIEKYKGNMVVEMMKEIKNNFEGKKLMFEWEEMQRVTIE